MASYSFLPSSYSSEVLPFFKTESECAPGPVRHHRPAQNGVVDVERAAAWTQPGLACAQSSFVLSTVSKVEKGGFRVCLCPT